MKNLSKYILVFTMVLFGFGCRAKKIQTLEKWQVQVEQVKVVQNETPRPTSGKIIKTRQFIKTAYREDIKGIRIDAEENLYILRDVIEEFHGYFCSLLKLNNQFETAWEIQLDGARCNFMEKNPDEALVIKVDDGIDDCQTSPSDIHSFWYQIDQNSGKISAEFSESTFPQAKYKPTNGFEGELTQFRDQFFALENKHLEEFHDLENETNPYNISKLDQEFKPMWTKKLRLTFDPILYPNNLSFTIKGKLLKTSTEELFAVLFSEGQDKHSFLRDKVPINMETFRVSEAVEIVNKTVTHLPYRLSRVANILIDREDNLFILGDVYGPNRNNKNNNTNIPGTDGILYKFKLNGELDWAKIVTTRSDDTLNDMQVDHEGNILVTGSTWGTFENAKKHGLEDIFLAKYSPKGELVWLQQFGSNRVDAGIKLSLLPSGNMYLVGMAAGSLDGQKVSQKMGLFVMKMAQ